MNCLRKLMVPLAIAATLASSVGPTASASAPKFKPMKYIGVVEGATVPANATDPQEVAKAQWMVTSARKLGANTIKVIRHWNETGDPGTAELDAICVTAQAMVANGMKTLLVSLMPRAYSYPTSSGDLKSFLQTIESYNSAFFGTRNCSSNAQLEVMWQVGNEMNISTFCRTGNDEVDDDENSRHAECARRAVYLQQNVFRLVQEQEKLYSVNMPVLGAGIGSHHSPISFLHHTNNAMRYYGYKHPGMDIFGFHPYALRGSVDPASGMKLLPKVMQVVKAVLGKNLPFMYDEMGFETITPQVKRDANCTTPPSVLLIPESHAASWTKLALKTSKTQGSVGYLNFLLADEKCENPGWQSGFYYWDLTPKPYLSEVSQVIRSYASSEAAASSPTPIRPFG